ncbi:hypothetical protein Enr13x_10750 [Stieleria neptunia]|uniref:Uncharacterized protein n=1 Tax=Stieleria neptunia TaxID=2527979 RepID=A0A518HK60_9BACT|nr:hypothetical protein Enr13x_10750 [Stieleria neptunia]
MSDLASGIGFQPVIPALAGWKPIPLIFRALLNGNPGDQSKHRERSLRASRFPNPETQKEGRKISGRKTVVEKRGKRGNSVLAFPTRNFPTSISNRCITDGIIIGTPTPLRVVEVGKDPTQSLARAHEKPPGQVERAVPANTVRFTNFVNALHRRRGAIRVLISLVHFKHPKAIDSQGSPRCAFDRIRLFVKEKHPRTTQRE